MELNEQQIKAVEHFAGPCLVTACPGSGKCVVGDTLILSGDKKISEIQNKDLNKVLGFEKENINLSSIKNIPISQFVDSGFHKMIKIVNKNGYELEGTYNHKICILGQDGNIEWKKLSDIKKRDISLIWSNKNLLKSNKFDDLFYLIGLMIGDASFAKNKRQVSFTSEMNNISKLYCSIVNKAFNYNPANHAHKDKRRKNLYSFGIYSKKITGDLKDKFGDIFHLSYDKYLTHEMLNGSYCQVASLLKGIYDTDGFINENGDSVGLILSSKKLIDQIHILFLHFGIFSTKTIKYTKYKGVRRKYYRIQIFGKDIERFYKHIGFNHKLKKKRLIKFINRNKKGNLNKTYPNQNKKMKLFCDYLSSKKGSIVSTIRSNNDYLRLGRYIINGIYRRSITEESISRFKNICDYNKIKHPIIKDLIFLRDNFSCSEITKIIYSKKPKQVYDYSIDKSHNFIANGFVNHNTSTITERVIKLIEKGTNSQNILCLTFTNKAANEMKQRIYKKLQVDKVDFFIGTFHSFCVTIIRQHPEKVGYSSKFTILDSKEQLSLLYQIARIKGWDRKEDNIDGDLIINIVNSEREKIKTIDEIADCFDNPIFKELAISYLEEIKLQNVIDFSGLLYEMYNILNENKDILDNLQERYKFILIDEFQDTNHIQYKITELLAGKYRNVFIVGDPDQSLYGFRNARYQNVFDFKKMYLDCTHIELGENYRSTPQIIKVANALIKHSKNRITNNIIETSNKDGPEVVLKSYRDPTEEAKGIANNIKYLVQEKGYDYSDIAILYRLNRLSLEFQMVFNNEHIPYVVLGGQSFFDRSEIKDALALLRFAVNPKDCLSFHRIAEIMGKIGDVTVGKIESITKNENMDLLLACKTIINNINKSSTRKSIQKIVDTFSTSYSHMNAGDCLFNIIEKIQYFDYLKLHFPDNFQERIDNVNELITNATEFSQKNISIEDYIQNISLLTSSDQENNNRVVLMTGHCAKGTEEKVVFSVGNETGIIPHNLTLAEAKTPKEREEKMSEERRILYVIFTRAKHCLFVSYCNNRKYRDRSGAIRFVKSQPSIFLQECGLLKDLHQEDDKYKYY